MKWFKHDSDANGDAKLKRVRIKYGLEGYGLYWYCLELIASDVSKDKITFELEHDAEIIAHDTGLHYERVQEMMTYMVNLGLFEQDGGMITCIKMAQRIDQSMTSNPHMRRIIDGFKGNNHDGVMTLSGKPMQDKTRLDEIKEKTLSPIGSADKVKVIPYEDIKAIYNEQLPTLTSSRVLSDKTKRQMSAIWKSNVKHQNREFWTAYFSGCGKLTGKMDNWTGAATGNKCGTIELLTRNEIFNRNLNEILDSGIWSNQT